MDAEPLEKIRRHPLGQGTRRGDRQAHGGQPQTRTVPGQQRVLERRGVQNSAPAQVHLFQERTGQHMTRQHNGRTTAQVQNDGDEKMMRHRQRPHHGVFRSDAQGLVGRVDTVADGLMREHHPLAGTGRAGGEADEGDVQPVIVRLQMRSDAREKAIRPQRNASLPRFSAQDGLQAHGLDHPGQFLRRPFRWDGNDDRPDAPQGVGERHVLDAVGITQTHPAAWRQIQTFQFPAQVVDALDKLGVGNRRGSLDDRRLLRPAGGGLVQ